jgi:hypothetical protein
MMIRAVAEDTDTLARVGARVTRTAGRWTQEDQDDVVLAVRRLKTINRDAVSSLNSQVASLATTALLLADSDVASAASADPTSISRHHHYSDEGQIERAERRDAHESLETESLRAGRRSPFRAQAARVREGVKTAAWNASPQNAESEIAIARRTERWCACTTRRSMTMDEIIIEETPAPAAVRRLTGAPR